MTLGSRQGSRTSESSDTDSEWSPRAERGGTSASHTVPWNRRVRRSAHHDNTTSSSALSSSVTEDASGDSSAVTSGECTPSRTPITPEDVPALSPCPTLSHPPSPSTFSASEEDAGEASDCPTDHTLSEYAEDLTTTVSTQLPDSTSPPSKRDGSPPATCRSHGKSRKGRGSAPPSQRKSKARGLPSYVQSTRLTSWASIPHDPGTHPRSPHAMYPLGFTSTVYLFFDGVPTVALRTIFSAISPLPIGVASFHTLYCTAREDVKYGSKYFDIAAGGVYIFHGIVGARLFGSTKKSRRVFPKLPRLCTSTADHVPGAPPAPTDRPHGMNANGGVDGVVAEASCGRDSGGVDEDPALDTRGDPSDRDCRSAAETGCVDNGERSGAKDGQGNGQSRRKPKLAKAADEQATDPTRGGSKSAPCAPAVGTAQSQHDNAQSQHDNAQSQHGTAQSQHDNAQSQHATARKRRRGERNCDAFLMVPEISVGSQYYVCSVDKRCVCRCHRREHPVSFAALRTMRICPKFHDGMTYYVYGFGRFRELRRDGFSRNYQNATCIIASIDGHLAIFQNTLLSAVKFFHEMTPAELSHFTPGEIVYDYRDQDPSVLADLKRRGFDLATVATECRPMHPPALSKKFKRWLGNFDAEDTDAYEQFKVRPATVRPATLDVVISCSPDLRLFAPPSRPFPPFSLARTPPSELSEFPNSRFIEYPPLAHHLIVAKRKPQDKSRVHADHAAAPGTRQSVWMRAHLHRTAIASAERERDRQLLQTLCNNHDGDPLSHLAHPDFLRLLHCQCKVQFALLHQRLTHQLDVLRHTLTPQQIAAIQLLLARVVTFVN